MLAQRRRSAGPLSFATHVSPVAVRGHRGSLGEHASEQGTPSPSHRVRSAVEPVNGRCMKAVRDRRSCFFCHTRRYPTTGDGVEAPKHTATTALMTTRCCRRMPLQPGQLNAPAVRGTAAARAPAGACHGPSGANCRPRASPCLRAPPRPDHRTGSGSGRRCTKGTDDLFLWARTDAYLPFCLSPEVPPQRGVPKPFASDRGPRGGTERHGNPATLVPFHPRDEGGGC